MESRENQNEIKNLSPSVSYIFFNSLIKFDINVTTYEILVKNYFVC